ncbi:MAG TPA: type II secretion system protein GspG, partial [Pyrinomonadaceae bacterium]
IALPLIGGACLLAKAGWDSAMDTAVYACVASIHQSLVNFGEKSPRGTGIALGTDWRELGPPEYDQVMERVKSEGSLDSGRSYWNEAGSFVDPWGRPYHIAGRAMPGGRAEFIVWSNGRDGASGSADDVVSPYGAKPPGMRPPGS